MVLVFYRSWQYRDYFLWNMELHMADFYDLVIPGKPLGKQRHQTTTIKKKDGTSFTHEFTPEMTVSYETFVKILFTEKYPDMLPIERGTPIFVQVFMFVPHSNESRKKGLFWAPQKPDKDNCEKIVYDAINNIAWADDCQICMMDRFLKVYSDRPHVRLRFRAVDKVDKVRAQTWLDAMGQDTQDMFDEL
jgi:Holliday junction resolvase RusA-like endonuclease